MTWQKRSHPFVIALVRCRRMASSIHTMQVSLKGKPDGWIEKPQPELM